MLADQLAILLRMADLAPAQARLIGAIRQWVVAQHTGRLPARALKERLGSARAAAHVELLLAEIACVWPDPFAVAPPCCRQLSLDETLVTDMLAFAMDGDRPGFDRLLVDLLPDDVRERLFLSMRVLGDVLDA